MQIVTKAIRKIKLLGASRSFSVIKHRAYSAYAYRLLKARYQRGNAQHSWQEVCTEMLRNVSIKSCIEQARTTSGYMHTLYDDQLELAELCDTADKAVARDVSLFGHTTSGTFNWHADTSVGASVAYGGNADGFSLDYRVCTTQSAERGQDIKVPWELSRLGHFFILGKAYQKTGNVRYSAAFVEQMQEWWSANNYLHGINWMCAMEVALRALTMIAAWHFFVHDGTITEDFWERYLASLYDHLHYLEHTFEWYDSRTNNHYLADIVGYAHLAHFFSFFDRCAQKRAWALARLERELCKQIGDDGFSYEGSTAYHRLVTELAYHGLQCAQACDDVSASGIHKIVSRMLRAHALCLDTAGNLVTIGDNDSGTVFPYGLARTLVEPLRTHHAIVHSPDFGLSIIKDDVVHFTLRHHVYHPLQPSGHFHADAGSITLSVHGIPVIIDPGTYVYTASSVWRNHLRSMRVHNSFMQDGAEPYVFADLFALPLLSGREGSMQCKQDGTVHISTAHDWYASAGLRAHRSVSYTPQEKKMYLRDWWTPSKNVTTSVHTAWRFTLAPDIRVEFYAYTCVNLYRHMQPLVRIESEHPLTIEPCFVSPGYLQKSASNALIMRASVPTNMSVIHTLTYI